MALQNYGIKKIRELLTERFEIPHYQREYSWEQTQLEDFWNDLKNLTKLIEKNPTETHFLGQILVHDDSDTNPREPTKRIIDGQQRTVTALILTKVFQSHFESFLDLRNEKEISSDARHFSAEIQYLFIGRLDPHSYGFKLKLGRIDGDFFKNFILINFPNRAEKENFNELSPSHILIKKAYWFLYEKIEDFLNSSALIRDKYKKLKSLYETFTDKFIVLYLEATSLTQAFVIFETLNERGKDLETSDLLKNHLFSFAVNDESKLLFENIWYEIKKNIDYSNLTKYIRYYWNSFKDFSREKDLYKKISSHVRDYDSANEFISDLLSISSKYNLLINPKEAPLFSEEIQEVLINLNTFKASSFYPIVISLLKKEVIASDVLEILKVLEKMIFRKFVISGENPNSSEIFFSNLALKIYSPLYSKETIIFDIKDQFNKDEKFLFDFANWEGSSRSKPIIRYIFRKIHQHTSNPDSETILSDDNDRVHIEHIMPENNDLWKVDDSFHNKFLWRLGNLTLLSGKLNKKNSNKPFNEKKEQFLSSQILDNSKLSEDEQWSENEIVERQKRLSKFALEIWNK